MPSVTERAFRDLVSAGLVGGTVALERQGKLGDLAFTFEVPVPHPNQEGLPASVQVRARIPAQFPNAKVEFVPVDATIQGFAHQDGRTGALCLKPGKEYSAEPSQRDPSAKPG